MFILTHNGSNKGPTVAYSNDNKDKCKELSFGFELLSQNEAISLQWESKKDITIPVLTSLARLLWTAQNAHTSYTHYNTIQIIPISSRQLPRNPQSDSTMCYYVAWLQQYLGTKCEWDILTLSYHGYTHSKRGLNTALYISDRCSSTLKWCSANTKWRERSIVFTMTSTFTWRHRRRHVRISVCIPCSSSTFCRYV